MGVIIQLRERLGVILLFLIGFAIVGFLLMDINFGGQQGATQVAGAVNGAEISIQEFEARVQESIENYKTNAQQPNVDEETIQFLRQQTWDQYVEEQLLMDQYEELGIEVTTDEMLELIQGQNVHPAIRQAFSDPETGQYNPAAVLNLIRNLDQDQTGETRRRWMSFEEFVKKDRLKAKYSNMIRKGLYTPGWQAKFEYNNQNKTVAIDYVMLPYADVADTEVEVTEDEMQDYISRHENKYKGEEGRSIKYITFDIYPTAKDSANALDWLKGKTADFRNAENDSIFIKLYSDLPYDFVYYPQAEMQSLMADTFFTIDTGTIVGPYMENGYYKLSKLVDRKLISDSVRASQILLTVRTQEELQTKRILLDSLLEVAQAEGADFAALARQFSEDPQTAAQGGDLGWVQRGELFESINAALFYQGDEGDVLKTGSDQGFHLLKITETDPAVEAVEVATLAKQILPSTETERAMYADASAFASKNNSQDAFQEAIKEMNSREAEKIKRNDYSITGLGLSRDIVKWAYEAEVGDVSNVFYLDDKYAVAMLTAKSEKGETSLANVRPEVEEAVRKEKKAEMLAEKVKAAETLDAAASAAGVEIESAENLSFSSPFIAGAGLEPKVVATALALSEGAVSEPIEGNNGVFVVKVRNITEPAETDNYADIKQQNQTELQSRIEFELVEALKKSAEVKDNRYQFY